MSIIKVNKFMTLDALEKQYPDMWAFFDIDKSGTDKLYDWDVNYFVIVVCKFEEKHLCVTECAKQCTRFDCMRTTEPPNSFWGTQFEVDI